MGLFNKKDKNTPAQVETPMQKAVGQINLAAYLAYISAGLTLVLILLSQMGFSPLGEYDLSMLVYVVIFGGLGFGVHRKSRVCAIVLLVIFILDKILLLALGTSASSMIASVLIWGSAYLSGVKGTFTYHKLIKEPQTQTE